MTNPTHKFLGLATLKEEGAECSFDSAFPETAKQKAARRAAEKRAYQALRDFEAAMKRVPKVLKPSWVAAQYDLAEHAHERNAITYLRRLVLWRMASGQIEHPQECASIVMPEGEEPYSTGW